ncbi:MAG: LEA type 2 family protein [Pseudomonadota bacterium]
MRQVFWPRAVVSAAVLMLAGCQSLIEQLQAPDVQLAAVRLAQADLTTQRFELEFAISNPNAIALPVKAVNYGVNLGGVSLASGSTTESFRVPANGDGAFSVSVEMSLVEALRTLGTRVLGGGEKTLDYDVGGSVALDLPLVQPLPFSAKGTVDVTSLR